MPELLLLEGEDLPGLMLQVRDRFGPRATIVRAERVRRGGLAGFFAREHYELTVEVLDNGVGVPPDFDAATSASLGLSIVRTLVGELGGTLRIVSRSEVSDGQDSGTLVELALPTRVGS